MKLLILAALFGLCAARDRIVGGDQAVKGDFPFIVHLDSSNVKAFCDASIISDRWLLSAAHCSQRGSGYTAVAGDQVLNDENGDGDEQAINILEFIPHEDYKSRTMENDIMLIKLEDALVMNTWVSPVSVPGSRPAAGVDCDISGWGNLLSTGTIYPNTLYWVRVPVISTAVCNTATSYDGEILDMMICIGAMEGGKDSCQGDSGGPVVLADTDTLVGIVSWGYGCAEVDYPGVYTDVYYFVANGWIDGIMSAN